MKYDLTCVRCSIKLIPLPDLAGVGIDRVALGDDLDVTDIRAGDVYQCPSCKCRIHICTSREPYATQEQGNIGKALHKYPDNLVLQYQSTVDKRNADRYGNKSRLWYLRNRKVFT